MSAPQHDEGASNPVVRRLGRGIRWDATAAIVASLVGYKSLAQLVEPVAQCPKLPDKASFIN